MSTLASPITRLPTTTMRPGGGAEIRHTSAEPARLDPFITADHFRMWQPTFAPHPHAGFSAVTYLFDDSETGFRNRDSLGGLHHIQPGSLHWTMAGSGVMHEEVPMEPGKVAHGLQIFVNLPASHKLVAPAAGHATAAQMPRLALGDGEARLAFGRYQGVDGPPMPAPGDATLLELRLPAGGSATLALGPGQQGLLIVIDGTLEVAQETACAGDTLAVDMGASVDLRAHGGAARVAWLAGTPWREPLVMHGPFGMNTQAQLHDAIARYQSGGMGRL
jgi:redox-sensitive bicupin YhaK (pirin superfamily)